MESSKWFMWNAIAQRDKMKSAIIIAIVVGISIVSVFTISEIIWYFANEEFEKVRDELKESLANTFEKQNEEYEQHPLILNSNTLKFTTISKNK